MPDIVELVQKTEAAQERDIYESSMKAGRAIATALFRGVDTKTAPLEARIEEQAATIASLAERLARVERLLAPREVEGLADRGGG
jgi:hypothetical protein